jgi:hypothetical protein
MSDLIDMFQQLQIYVPNTKRKEYVRELRAAATGSWTFDIEDTKRIERNASTTKSVSQFTRMQDDECEKAALTLWENNDGFYVSNIVPRGTHRKLEIKQYNAILRDFNFCLATPIADKHSLRINMSKPKQGLADWMAPDTAQKLKWFSVGANKSTGTAHPSDEEHWFEFIVAAHKSRDDIGTDTLTRWLIEVEGWHEDIAHDLAGDFERSMALLAHFEKS